ncbi:hypothetical protein [Streptomyces coeruleorubidus]|uniref:hypothetical protein n=1 Tax=Streptomyces coeruleorubidus TaxID=116188 RepID=UPI0033A12D45
MTTPLMSGQAGASESTLSNPGFERGDLSGWSTTGTAFHGSVTNQPGWGWGCCFNQQGTYHLWGFAGGGDAPTGTVTSEPFTLTGTGMVSVLVSGGRNDDQLYVALTTLDGTVLHKATGTDDEAYRRVTWDAREHLGEQLRITAVDRATGGWGHINLDDVRVGLDKAPARASMGSPPTGTSPRGRAPRPRSGSARARIPSATSSTTRSTSRTATHCGVPSDRRTAFSPAPSSSTATPPGSPAPHRKRSSPRTA